MKHRLMSWVVMAGYNTTVGMSWSGLEEGKRYLGAARFLDQDNVVRATTVLRVETGSAGIPTAQSERPVPKEKIAE